MKINVGSWNILVYGSRDFKGIAKLLKKNKIDIIGIQEAAIYFDKDKTENITEKIAKELKFDYVFYPAFDSRPAKPFIMGNAILSKFPIKKSKFYPLNPPTVKKGPETQPRILVFSEIQLNNNKTLNLLTTHLQFTVRFETSEMRLAQVEKIISVIKRLDNPIVLTGDFNSTPKNQEIKMIEKILKRVDGLDPTWTVLPIEVHGWHVDELLYRLDNIFVSRDLKYEDFEIVKSKISDHLPIKVTIDI